MKFAVTKDTQRMLGQVVSSRSGPTNSDAGKTTSAEGEAIAVREVGPITVILRNVSPHTSNTRQGRTIAMRCTFDIENRSLKGNVAIAANGLIDQAIVANGGGNIIGFRGDIV